jgi:hypothetical protein
MVTDPDECSPRGAFRKRDGKEEGNPIKPPPAPTQGTVATSPPARLASPGKSGAAE